MSTCPLHRASLPCPTCASTDAVADAIHAAEQGLPAWSQKDADGRELMRGDRVRLADGRLGRALDFTDSGRRVLVRVSAHRALAGLTAVTVDTASVCRAPIRAASRRRRAAK